MYKAAAKFRCPSSRISVGGALSGKKTDKAGSEKIKKKSSSPSKSINKLINRIRNSIGKKIDGVVESIVEYGAFVNLGGISGLIHISELSDNRVKVSDMLKTGQKVSPRVIKVDQEVNGKYRIALSLKG